MNYRNIHELCSSADATPGELDQFLCLHIDINAERGESEYSLSTPLSLAVENNTDPEFIQLLIDAGADVDAFTSGRKAIHRASERNPNPEVISLLLKANGGVNERQALFWNTLSEEELGNELAGLGGQTPLMLAASRNNHKVVQRLIDHDADVNAMHWIGTALHFAASSNKDLAVIQCLLEAGANIDVLSPRFYHDSIGFNGGETPIENAAWSNSAELMELLLLAGADPGSTSKVLFRALQAPMDDLTTERKAKLLLNAGVPLRSGMCSPLNAAISRDHYKPNTIRLLLEAGADPNFGNPIKDACSALSHIDGGVEIISLLLDAGANVLWEDSRGDSCCSIIEDKLMYWGYQEGVYVQALNLLKAAVDSQKKALPPPTLLERIHRLFE